MKHSKRFENAVESFERLKEYPISEAVEILKKFPQAKFDETVEVSIKLGVDAKHAEQQVRGTVSLPFGTGKELKVLVLTKGPKQKEAEEAGADLVGFEEYIEKIQGGWIEFDAIVATPDVMGDVGRLGKILGPRGLMPNPKSGTVTMDVGKAVRDLKAGRVELRTDKFGVIHSLVGKISFEAAHLVENINELMGTVMRLRPSGAKGTYLKALTISSTMSPGIRVDRNSVTAA